MPSLWTEAEGYYESPNLSKELRMAVKPGLRIRQFCDIKDPDQQQRFKGAKYHWNVYSKVTPDSGLATRVLDESKVMPTGNFTITQGELTITERGLAVPYTGKYDDLSEHPVKEIIHQILKRDCKEALDIEAAAEFNKTPLRVCPTSGNHVSAVTLTTNGATATTNNIALGKKHVRTITTLMKERNIPCYSEDDYYCIAWPSTFETFRDDLEGIQVYHETGFGFIARGEIGRYSGCRFIEQTNVPKGSLGTKGSAWANGSDWALFFGADTVAEAVAIPEEIRGRVPLDYGRDKGIAWYSLGGFGLCHTQVSEARIVMWDSL
jgi:hypothetical protein